MRGNQLHFVQLISPVFFLKTFFHHFYSERKNCRLTTRNHYQVSEKMVLREQLRNVCDRQGERRLNLSSFWTRVFLPAFWPLATNQIFSLRKMVLKFSGIFLKFLNISRTFKKIEEKSRISIKFEKIFLYVVDLSL